MATYYVDPINGDNGDDGLSWANAFLTLNGAEDEPVAANDTVYVGPGVYREMLTLDVSGGAGTEITYIADVTGENTDGVGGEVRVTGSDNDTTTTRNQCITDAGVARSYRIFQGFRFDMAGGQCYRSAGGGTNNTLRDCVFGDTDGVHVYFSGANQADHTIERCIFLPTVSSSQHIYFLHAATVDNTGHVVENCILTSGGVGIWISRIGGITIRNCAFHGRFSTGAIVIANALSVGQQTDVENSIFQGNNKAFVATAVGEIVEDYNTLWGNGTDYTLTNAGANTQAYPALFSTPVLHAGASQVSGYKFPWWYWELSEWSQIAAITGSNEPTEDLRGIVRPTTASKNSWGPCQFFDAEREIGTVRTGAASITFHDAGSHQIWVPTTDDQITVTVYCYREANYAGVNPTMVIKQPGVADRTTTDAAAASQWNQLTDTFTPAALPDYCVIELQSRNTAAAGNYDAFFDDLDVS